MYYYNGDTIFHVSNDSSSQIDYSLLAVPHGCPLEAELLIADMHYLITSDHTYLELSLTFKVSNSGQVITKQEKSGVNKMPWENLILI